MNLVEAQTAIKTAQQRMVEANKKHDAQLRAVRDYERQIAEVTPETDMAVVSGLTSSLTAARALLAACNREVQGARAAHDLAVADERRVRERIGEVATRVATSEGAIRSLNRGLQEAEHRVESLRAGLGSEQRSLARDKAELAALKCVDAVTV